MSLERCLCADSETRDNPSNIGNRVKHFEQECPKCFCEAFSFGRGSPGIVQDAESLIRFFFSPHDCDDSGNPLPFAFQELTSVGFSVVRDGADDNALLYAAQKRLLNMKFGNKLVNVGIAQVSDVRKIEHIDDRKPPCRAFCVYDTAEPDVPMHAEVCNSRGSRSDRLRLRELFKAGLSPHYRDGLLSNLKPKEALDE